MVFGHIVDVDTGAVGDGIQNGIEGNVKISVSSVYVLIGGIQDVLFNFSSFLVI